jgi:hypothetical protein
MVGSLPSATQSTHPPPRPLHKYVVLAVLSRKHGIAPRHLLRVRFSPFTIRHCRRHYGQLFGPVEFAAVKLFLPLSAELLNIAKKRHRRVGGDLMRWLRYRVMCGSVKRKAFGRRMRSGTNQSGTYVTCTCVLVRQCERYSHLPDASYALHEPSRYLPLLWLTVNLCHG